jgi:Flp pilus assembly protein TadG
MTTDPRPPTSREQNGAILVLFALLLTALMVMAAFAVDVGSFYARAQQIQRAADASALAGTIWMPGNFAKASAVAIATADANGFTNGASGVTVTVGPGANPRQLKVTITDTAVRRYLSRVIQRSDLTLTRSAVAQYDLPVPLGSPENQLGGGNRGIYLAVNGYCSRRADGDYISSGFYNTSSVSGNVTCASPYASASPTGTTAKNPDFSTAGYSYVVELPPKATGAPCLTTPPSIDCSTTAADVMIQVVEPKFNTSAANGGTDPDVAINPPSSCTPSGASTTASTIFTVYAADDTPLDDSNNPLVLTKTYNTESANSLVYEDLYKVNAGSLAGRYLVKVRSGSAECSGGWANSFGIRARVGLVFLPCSTLPGAVLPVGTAFCPQVHGDIAMGLRAQVGGALATCVGTKNPATNLCAQFYLAQIDPAYAGRSLVLTMFDPGEGAQRLRLLQPDGTTVGFTYQTVDTGTPMSGTAAAATGLDVTGSVFNDRKLDLVLTLPNAAGLTTNGGWYKVEYEVSSTQSVTDRTTWGATVRGTPVRLTA